MKTRKALKAKKRGAKAPLIKKKKLGTLSELEKIISEHNRGCLSSVDWLQGILRRLEDAEGYRDASEADSEARITELEEKCDLLETRNKQLNKENDEIEKALDISEEECYRLIVENKELREELEEALDDV